MARIWIACAAALLCVAAGASPVAAQSRQGFSGTFTTEAPGASSGYRLAIDYANPSDPAAKPHSVQQVVQTLAAGTRIDTAVAPRCAASDQQLSAQGAAACPAGTVVGAGEIDVDFGTATGATPRVVQNRVTVFNAEDALILFTESTNTTGEPIRTASRSRVAGRSITTDAPPLPAAPPPDAFLAIKRVRLSIGAVTAPGGTGALITTPGSCPSGGAWETEGRFTYRDGASQSVTSRSPCRASGASVGGRRRVRPRVRIRGVPRRRCVRRAFRARVAVSGPALLRRAHTRVDGRMIRRTRSKRFRIRVAPRRPGMHRLTVVVRDRAGSRGKAKVRFRSCR